MRILLLGASGFIGQWIQAKLHHSDHVTAMYAPSRAELDLLDLAAVRDFLVKHPVDQVIYAVNSRVGADCNVLDYNTRMFFNVTAGIDAMLRRHSGTLQQFLFLGSGAEYDKSRGLKNVSEMDFGDYVPADPLGFSKYLCARHLERAPYPCVNLRCFGVYGPGEDDSRFITSAIKSALAGQPIRIRQDVQYEYTWVEDVAHIVRLLVEAAAPLGPGCPAAMNMGNGVPVLLSQLAQLVREEVLADVPVIIEKPGLQPEYTCNAQRLGRWFPQYAAPWVTSHRRGIQQLVNHYRAEIRCKLQETH